MYPRLVCLSFLAACAVPDDDMSFQDTGTSPARPKLESDDLELTDAEEFEILEYISGRYDGVEVVGTVYDPTGQAFDCVLADRQPGLRRRNPSTGEVRFEPYEAIPEEVLEEARRLADRPLASPDESYPSAHRLLCPAGTVPFKQPSFEAIASFGSLSAYLERYWEAPAVTGHEYAKTDYYGDNTGGAAVFNIWNPSVASSYEFSLSQIWLVRGNGSDKQTLEAGWQDYPGRTGSLNPRFFVYSTQDGYASHGTTDCYDQECDDWVQVSSDLAPGFGWANHSSSGGSQYVFDMSYYRAATNGNWYLIYKGDVLGYYPSSLFDADGLANKAARISLGGEVAVDNTSWHSGTDMGSGAFPSSGFQYATYTRTIERRSVSLLTWSDIPIGSLGTYVTDPGCYDLTTHSGSSPWNTNFYFGGPGYQSVACP